METVIGKIAGVEGIFYIKGLDGSLRKALQNDPIYNGEIVIGDANNIPTESVTVSIADGSEIVLLGKEKQLFDSSLLNREFSNEDTVTGKDSIQALLEKNGDIDNIEDLETAAGEEESVDSTDGVDSVFLDPNGAITDVNADLRDVAFAEETTESRDDNYFLNIETAPVTVTVDAINDVTTVVNDTAATNEDAAVNIDVVANDTDVDAKSPVATVTQGSNGTVVIESDGTLTYTPDANFNGEDTFTYTNEEGNTGTVNVEVEAVADAPLLSVVSDVVVSQTIGIDNVTDTNNGFTVTALDINGAVTTISTNTSPEGFGVTGAASGADSELGGSEKLVVTFENPVDSVDVSFAWMNSSESASYTFYKNGVEVGTGLSQFGSDGVEAAETLKPSSGSEFDTIVFSAPYSGDDYLIHSITYDKVESTSGAVTVEEGEFIALNISSSLVDIDGSESLDIVLNDIPAGFILSDGTNSFTADSSNSSVNITNWSLSSLVLTTSNVDATTTYTLNVVATSTEASNGDSASTVLPFEVTVNNNANLMILNDDVAQVDEAALTTGTNSISDAEVVSGNLLSDDTLPAGALLSSVAIAGGTTVVDADTITVTTAEGNELVVDVATGDYTYTLINPVDHSVLDNADDIFTYTVTDSFGVTQSANLTVTIADDAPVVNNTTSIMVSSPDTVDTNIVFTLDVSGSMDEIVTGTTTSFDIAKQALIDTIDAYSKQGDVNVNLTLFNGGAVSLGWKNETEILDYLSRLTMNHSTNTVLYDGSTITGLTSVYTNYEAALEATSSTYNTGLPTADNTVAYFLSDGAPTVENNEGKDVKWNVGTDSESGWLDTPYVTNWTTFIDLNNIDLTVIGIGDNLSTSYLDLVQVQDGKSAIVVSDATQLSDTITSNIQIVEGTLYDLDGSAGISFGADGGYISELTYNNTLYTYDAADPKQEIALSEGTMELDFDTGNYIYTPTVSSGNYLSEEFNITIVDNDGDSHTDNLTLNIVNDVITFEPTTDVDAGGGYDILLVESSIDFSLVTNEVKNIEEINLGDGAQDVTLTLSDVLSVTDSDNDLYITGDGDIGDSVSLDTADGWSKSASQSQVGFNEYSSTEDPTVKLQIQDDLEVKLS
ncbi:MAG TPA: Ig-like domain-containing protein [Sulfurimonas sp.]